MALCRSTLAPVESDSPAAITYPVQMTPVSQPQRGGGYVYRLLPFGEAIDCLWTINKRFPFLSLFLFLRTRVNEWMNDSLFSPEYVPLERHFLQELFTTIHPRRNSLWLEKLECTCAYRVAAIGVSWSGPGRARLLVYNSRNSRDLLPEEKHVKN